MKHLLLVSAATCLLAVQTANAKGCLEGARWVASQDTWNTIHSWASLVGALVAWSFIIYIPSGKRAILTAQ